jgi:hypothetical protein
MGDAVKEIALDELGSEATSHEIGHWATVSREVNGPAVMAERITEKWDENGPPREPVHIEGVRSIEETLTFRDYFGNVPVVFIEAPFETRLERLQERGRDGEDAFDHHDLWDRDYRESEWGLKDLEVIADYQIQNTGSLAELKNRVGSYLQTVLAL